MSCRTCKFLDVKPDRGGRIVPRKDKAYRCLAPVPELDVLKLPASVCDSHWFRWPPSQSSMCPDMGEGCLAHEPRKPCK